jgi:hypothetical protein
MGGGIYLIKDDGSLVEMAQEGYVKEDHLQRLLEDYPNLLGGDQIDEEVPRRWLLVGREVAVPGEDGGAGRWALDHLFLDQDGIPTLVEVKRSSDTRIRREVVGQVLDYAANGVAYWPIEQLRSALGASAARSGREPDEVVAEFLGPEADVESFWATVAENLRSGTVRMLFVADEIPRELRRIVEFLNEQMSRAEVLAVEIKQFAGSGHRTLVPRVIGGTVGSSGGIKPGRKPRRKWNEADFFDALARSATGQDVRTARELLAWCRQEASDVVFGTGRERGSFLPSFDKGGWPFRPFSVWTDATLWVQFGYLDKHPALDQMDARQELARRLNAIPGVEIRPEHLLKGWPSIPLAVFAAPQHFEQLKATILWAVERVYAGSPK